MIATKNLFLDKDGEVITEKDPAEERQSVLTCEGCYIDDKIARKHGLLEDQESPLTEAANSSQIRALKRENAALLAELDEYRKGNEDDKDVTTSKAGKNSSEKTDDTKADYAGDGDVKGKKTADPNPFEKTAK